METIIQDFFNNVTKNNGEQISFNSLGINIKKESNHFGLNILKFLIEKFDEDIKNSSERKRAWYVERYDKRTIFTPLGKLTFRRTYYANKHNKKKYAYLLDQALGINKYARMDVSIEAKLVNLSNDLSFEKAGKLANENMTFSKQTVKNKLDKFGEVKGLKPQESENKKKIKYLYIDADEDHISLQTGKNKINKLVYVYEGKIRESKNRNYLLNKRIFASVKKSPEDLWLEVLDYIYATYDLEYIDKIYIQGDGANWIKTGVKWIDKSVHVIDMFHLNKGIMKLVGGNLKDGNGYELKKLVYSKDKCGFLKLANQILLEEKDEIRYRKKEKALSYVKNQWKGIEEFMKHKSSRKLGCSAEGHVSHILASRMSSRPVGWSIDGLENMTKLRMLKENGGTLKDIENILKTKNKELALKCNLKNIKRIKKKSGEMLDNLPVITNGQMNGSFYAIKSLSVS